MFVFSKWDGFCKFIFDNKLKCIRADEIQVQIPDSKWIAIKHDVETDVNKALQMAKIECKYGIRATYYVQSYLLESNSSVLSDIQSLGHEVSYHYDVLDANNGDYESAIKEFSATLLKFESLGFKINTICPHGNPVMIRSGWNSNKDFFKNINVRDLFPGIFDVVVDSKSNITEGFVYISDAGYGWKKIGNVYDNDKRNIGDSDLQSIEGVVSELECDGRFIISCHPHRWERSKIKATYNLYLFKMIKCVVKPLLRVGVIKKSLSNFYYLAKKL
ncbi:MAG: hypothetical protein OES20_14085 [Gammaproteobacteria bacterium]|nr:hypothetical protein [Gammaproteobacteria bacterium]